jgi:hypothetical protein
MSAIVVGIYEARRPRRVLQRLELPRLEDVDSFLAELEEERWFARGRGDWLRVREATRIIDETQKLREVVVQRAFLRCVK